MTIFDKHFTLEEARTHLPWLREQCARIALLLGNLEDLHIAQDRVEKLVRSNGHAVEQQDYRPEVAEIQAIVQEISDKGIQIKDLGRGLIDFPAWIDGEEVLLCWLAEEEDIEFWHTVDGGFAGRTRLES